MCEHLNTRPRLLVLSRSYTFSYTFIYNIIPKMKIVSVIAFSLCVAVCFAAPPAKPLAGNQKQGTYTTKYDNINIDEILNNPKLIKNYVGCLVNNVGCTPQGKELRDQLPDALKTQCLRCTEAQKNGSIKVINKLRKDYPDDWKKLSDKWDPTGEYFRKLSAQLEAEKKAKH